MDSAKEVFVLALGMTPEVNQPILILADRLKTRAMPLLIGELEANSIGLALSDQEMKRPPSHALIVNILKELDNNVKRVMLDESGDSCSAIIEISNKSKDIEEVVELEARVTDAIALALRSESPIYVSQDFFKEHSVKLTLSDGGIILGTEEEAEPAEPPVADDDFKDFLGSLKASDFNEDLLDQ